MSSRPFTTGGTVQAGPGLYIRREADRILLDHCLTGTYAYVLAARQVGKSSLMISVANELRKKGIAPAIVDLTAVGMDNVDANRWYTGLLRIIVRQLGLNLDAANWWLSQSEKSHPDRFISFFREVALPAVKGRVVVFFDEIDTTLGLKFTDDFFAAIRSLYNARSNESEFDRLSFVFIGVAAAPDLMKDRRRTPFNIAQPVDLQDFTKQEAVALAAELPLPDAQASEVLDWVLAWTGGHPYLTQRLLREMWENPPAKWTKDAIDSAVQELFLGEHVETDNNLKFVGDRLSEPGRFAFRVLTTYAAILRGTIVLDSQSPVKSRLRLAGVVKREGLLLKVRNQIYARVFTKEWVEEQRAIRKERATRAASWIAVVMGLIALILAGYSWDSRVQAIKSAAQARSEAALREQADAAKEQALAAKEQALAAKDDLQKAEELETELRKSAEGQRVIAEARARLAQDNAELAKRNELSANQQRLRADDNARQADENAQKAAASAAVATQAREQSDVIALANAANARLATERLQENKIKSTQITGYKVLSDAKFLETQPDPNDLGILLSIEGNRLAPSFDAVQTLTTGLDRLPKRISWDAKSRIDSLALDEAGSTLAFSIGGEVHTINLQTMKETPVHNSLIQAGSRLAFVPVGGQNKRPVQLITKAPPGRMVLAVDPGGAGYVTRGADNKVIEFWGTDGSGPHELRHQAAVDLATFSASELVTLCGDSSIYEWDLRDFRSNRIELEDKLPLAPPFPSLLSVDFLYPTLPRPIFTSRLAISLGRSVRIYQPGYTPASRFKVLRRTKFVLRQVGSLDHESPVSAMLAGSEMSGPNSNTLTTASGQILHRWDLVGRREIFRVNMPKPIAGLAASGDERWVATADATGGVQVWLTEGGAVVAWMKRSGVASVAFGSGDEIILGSAGGSASMKWSWGRDELDVNSVLSTGDTLSFSTDGSHVLIFQRAPQAPRRRANPDPGAIQGAPQPASETSVQSPGAIVGVSVEATTGSAMEMKLPISGTPKSAVISPNGKFSAVWAGDQIQLFDNDKGALTASLTHPNTVRLGAVSPDGRMMLLTSSVPRSGVVSVEVLASDGKLLDRDPIATTVSDLAFSPDGRFFSISTPERIQIFDTSPVKLRTTIQPPSVSTAAFTPDGKYFAGANATNIRIWDTDKGSLISLVKTTSTTTSLAFSHDGKYLAAGSNDGIRVLVWRPEDLIAEACSRARTKRLTPDQWKNYFGDEEYHDTCPARALLPPRAGEPKPFL